MNLIENTEALLKELKFAQLIRNELTHVRLIHETDEQTFGRILRLGAAQICVQCRGYGRPMFGDSVCSPCNGTGKKQ